MLNELMIGNVSIKTPIGLAPLAGVTDLTFRKLCLEHGAGLVTTEMVSAKAIVYKNKNTEALMKSFDGEHPSSIQLFGSDPDALSEAVRMIETKPFDMIDFNMGCPVPKVVRNGEGSALMTDPEAAAKAMRALVLHTKKPVTVKMRAGFDSAHINAVEIAKLAQDCGVSAIAVHGRTREQYYSGRADLGIIKQVKEAVSIPVFGNGDVVDGPSALNMLEKTGCDGLLVGRGAMGNPWIFEQIRYYLETGNPLPLPSQEAVFDMIITHAQMLCEQNGEKMGIRQMRSHAASYIKGFRCAAKMRGKINYIETLDDLKTLFSYDRNN